MTWLYPYYGQVNLITLTVLILSTWRSWCVQSFGLDLIQKHLIIFFGYSKIFSKHQRFIGSFGVLWIEGIVRQLARVYEEATDNIS